MSGAIVAAPSLPRIAIACGLSGTAPRVVLVFVRVTGTQILRHGQPRSRERLHPTWNDEAREAKNKDGTG